MSEFEYHALKTMTEWFWVWTLILALGFIWGWPGMVLSLIGGACWGTLAACGEYRVVPGNPIRVVRR